MATPPSTSTSSIPNTHPPAYDSLASSSFGDHIPIIPPSTASNDNENEPLPRYFPPLLPFKQYSGLLLPLFLLPLSLLLLFTLADDSAMSSAGTFAKSFLAPALIALALYLTLHFAALPLYRRHRARYAQYLPVSSLSTSPTPAFSLSLSSLSSLSTFLLPSRWAEWRHRHRHGHRVVNAQDGEEDEEEEMGEDLEFELEGEGERERRRRDGLSLSIDARRGGGRQGSSDRRLSRELEEGFADSSDEEGSEDGGEGRR